MESATPQHPAAPIPGRAFDAFFNSIGAQGPKPLAERLKIELNPQSLGVSAVLTSAAEADKLIKMLEANKALLPEPALDVKPETER